MFSNLFRLRNKQVVTKLTHRSMQIPIFVRQKAIQFAWEKRKNIRQICVTMKV
jgi:hypothetical protein